MSEWARFERSCDGGAILSFAFLEPDEPPGPSAICAPAKHVSGVRFGGGSAFKKRVENALLIGIPLVGSILAVWRIVEGEFSWIDVASFAIFYLLVGLGTALGLHRYFSHRSFETTGVIAFLLGAFGSMAFQGSISRWVADHRRHHAHTDVVGDVHSPEVDPWGLEIGGLKGFLYAHAGWMFDSTTTDLSVYGSGLQDDPVIRFFDRTYWLWTAASLAAPYAFGYLIGGADAAFSSMLFGGCLRTTVLHNVVWAVNSVGHTIGTQNFEQSNSSKNNLILAILTFGDGWHNNHHRFPRSAFHGLLSGEVDVNGHIIELLEKLGWARDIVRVSPEQLRQASAVSTSHE